MKTVSQVSHSPGREVNPEPPEYKAGMSSDHSVWLIYLLDVDVTNG
jgi:hypothetical protein